MLELNIVTMYNYTIRTKKHVEDSLLGKGIIVVEFLHNYRTHFQMYSDLIFSIFQNVFQEDPVPRGFCTYEFVNILTDIMQIIVKNLFQLTCDLSKRNLAQSILKIRIDSISNSKVFESVKLYREANKGHLFK